MKKRIAILGSTGSIGTQALEVVDNNPDEFEIEVLTARNNYKLLIKQAIKYKPNTVVIGNEKNYKLVSESLSKYPIKVFTGIDAISQIVEMSTIDIVLIAMVGYSGLLPTIKAIEAGKTIALANKETLVVAGELITKLTKEKNVNIYPVDSEHSAIFQCLVGETGNPIEKIYLTASGGPFRGKDLSFLKKVTKTEALKHPNWNMGNKITIDSATLMNKGFEVIEAKWLFDLKPEQIKVIVHPQSIIHSIVQFEDGSMKAQMGLPDMKLPIQYALGFPNRLKSDFKRFNFFDYPNLTFEEADTKNFRNLTICFDALKKGGNIPCIINAANEIVVEAFLNDKIGFVEMPDIIEKVVQEVAFIKNPDFNDYVNSDNEARIITKEIITNQYLK
ncbi:MAG: 1-deoxy-D-xylulose-5-phosphate reductoisomerase [Bacteroidales bacterium]|nr:1-deoxy-D-xylulose-5-phosphate reductoisomerase [Bacteroidales bacterium]